MKSDPVSEPVVVEPKPLKFGPVIASVIVPGLGQLFQRRYSAFFGHFFLFFIGIGAACFMPSCLVLSALLAAFSGIDAATGVRGFPSRIGGPINCLATVTILVALTVPPYRIAMEAAYVTTCIVNAKRICLAFYDYHEKYGTLPPAYTVDENGRPLHSWRVLILPFLEQQELYDRIRLDEPWDSEYNRQFHDIVIPAFHCRAKPAATCPKWRSPFLKPGNCYFSVVVGDRTPFPGSEPLKVSDIMKDLPNTILVVERMTPVCWMDPNNEIRFDTACEGANRNLLGIGGSHQGIAVCCTGDGMYHYLTELSDPRPMLLRPAENDSKPVETE